MLHDKMILRMQFERKYRWFDLKVDGREARNFPFKKRDVRVKFKKS